ncbi:hypothetical protein GH714_003539 [Hevea brasiliensis]|uniref:CCT domain-containing protein n=1 Tax=Hevea brasiliensis TaxID=3981 RepID=A0A6A6LIG6_HEVBR|nr:hypothetical protein GH714_003539 [Hevea brasiliensis]
MYGHSHPMNVHHQITAPTADEEDGVAADSIDHHHIRYEDGNATGVVVEDVSHDSVYVPSSGAGSELVVHRGDVSSQLTLTFRGQVYVFDAVTPDKVQAVLLLLGGCELTSGLHGLEVASQNQRGAVVDFPGRCTQPQRAASLHRFRQKRKERCFDKKVRYSVRQEVALRMQRNKGQFTSSKKSDGPCGWGGGQDSGQDDSQQETSKNKFPIDLRSLGVHIVALVQNQPDDAAWSIRPKGTLRDLSRKTQEHSVTPIEQGEAEANDSVSGNAIHTHNSLVTY